MISNEKLIILDIWRKNPFIDYSISEIMKLMKKNTKTWVFNKLKEISKLNLIEVRKKSNLNLYSLNLNNPKTFQILYYLDIINTINFSQNKIINEIINNVPGFYVLLVFGSYANNNFNKKSDIDICFLIENKSEINKIKPYLKDIKLNYAIEIDEHFILFKEFIKMLIVDEENLAKQVVRKHILFYNGEIYYKLLIEAYKNGFRL
ncbi:MAG: nucleotidyltransferase domain-containing protein [Candidatus Woesearchaeota archaeon]